MKCVAFAFTQRVMEASALSRPVKQWGLCRVVWSLYGFEKVDAEFKEVVSNLVTLRDKLELAAFLLCGL